MVSCLGIAMRAMLGGFCLPSQGSGEFDSRIPGVPLSLGPCFALKFKLFCMHSPVSTKYRALDRWVFTVDFSWK
jgi:hypothetical protein